MDVGHLGTADAEVDPADHVAEDALGVVVELGLDLVRAPVRLGRERNGQEIRSPGAGAAGDRLLARRDVHLEIVERMKRRRGRGGHPGGRRAGHRMGDLLGQHGGHAVGRRPHALADLRAAGQAAGEPGVDVAVLIGLDPGGGPHVGLAHHGAGFHRGVDLVAGAVEEAGVDEDHPAARRVDRGGKVRRGAAFLVHDAHLQRIAVHAEPVLDEGEQAVGEGDLLRTVHLRLHDVDRAGDAVGAPAVRSDVVQRDRRGDDGVEEAFRDFLAGLVEHRVGRHQVTDVAHQHEAAALEEHDGAVRGDVGTVVGKVPRHLAAALVEGLDEVALHQAEPVAVDEDLVLGVDGGDRILAVHDGGERAFDDEIGDAGGVRGADRPAAVDADLQVESVLLEKDRRRFLGVAFVAGELRGIVQGDFVVAGEAHRQAVVRDPVADGVGVAAGGEREDLVEERATGGNDRCTAGRIVARRP